MVGCFFPALRNLLHLLDLHVQSPSTKSGVISLCSPCFKTCQNFSFHIFLGTVLFSSLNLEWSGVAGSGFEALKEFPWAEDLPTSLQVFVASVASLVQLCPPKGK